MVFNYSSKYYIVALSGTLIIWVSGYMDLSSQQQVKGTAQAFDPKTVGNCREVEAAAEILTNKSNLNFLDVHSFDGPTGEARRKSIVEMHQTFNILHTSHTCNIHYIHTCVTDIHS